jgi:hypothetical protein
MLDKNSNASMFLADKYPSSVFLNVTRLPGVQIASCDAVVEVYGVKISTDTGPIEYHAYFIGTNYNPSFWRSDFSNLVPYVSDLVDHGIYSEITGGFVFNWTANTSIFSHTIGSIGAYTNRPSNYTGLWSAGKPNDISVTVYRIGYVTITNGSVSLFSDVITSATAVVHASSNGNGLLYNKILPAEKLAQVDSFHPIDPSCMFNK